MSEKITKSQKNPQESQPAVSKPAGLSVSKPAGLSSVAVSKPKKLLEQVSEALRTKHYAYRTEQTYVDWIKRYILFHKKRHPNEMGAEEIREFIAHLATERKVATSTQNPCTEPVEVRRSAPSSFYTAPFWKKKSSCHPNLSTHPAPNACPRS